MTNKQHFTAISAAAPWGERLALAEDGTLYASSGEKWTPMNWNACYQGFYSTCHFTAIACALDAWYAAGVGTDGTPHLFYSIGGGVWHKRELVMLHPTLGQVVAKGRILSILTDDKRKELYLICHNGELVILPDCHKCTRIRQISAGEVTGATLEDRQIALTLSTGDSLIIALDETSPLRASLSYMRTKQCEGSVLVDLRSAEEQQLDGLPGSIYLPVSEMVDWLHSQDKNALIFFICHRGTHADFATAMARSIGYYRSYSLGGMAPGTYID